MRTFLFQGADHGHFALRVGPNLSNVMHGLDKFTLTSAYDNPIHRISPFITSSIQNSLFSLHFVGVGKKRHSVEAPDH
jgi:hypothetical protein